MLRVLDEARTWLFPLYSSALTPAWLRALGPEIGTDVEASTVLMIPQLTDGRRGAFLADDTLVGGYELGGGWLRVERVKIGKRAFLGNSGMAAPGRRVPKRGLVAVLSAAPATQAEGRARPGWAARRCRCVGAAGASTDDPHVRPAAPAQGGARPGRAVPDRPGDGSPSRSAARRASPLLERAAPPAAAGGRRCSAARCCWRPALVAAA